jgi:hypothetical protein
MQPGFNVTGNHNVSEYKSLAVSKSNFETAGCLGVASAMREEAPIPKPVQPGWRPRRFYRRMAP